MNFQQRSQLPIKPLPIVIIGAGGIVRDAHLPAYKLAGFSVLGVFDVDLVKAQALQDKLPFIKKVYPSLDILLDDAQKNNAVFDIAVPAQQLYKILQQIPDGSPVLMQKPMGENLEEAQHILELCRKKKLVSAVNFQLRYAPYILAAKDMIEKGLLGDVYDMEIKVCVYTPWHLWDFLYQSPRVEILYHSIHYLDLIRSFWGNPKKIYASTIKHPKMKKLAATRSSMILDYDEYKQARTMTNHGHEFGLKHQESYLKIEGTKGALKIRIGLSLDYPKGMPPKFEYFLLEDESKEWKEILLEGGWFPHAFIGTMAVLQNHYLNRAVPLPHSTEDAFETMKLVELAYRSSNEGGIKFE